jgi:hypothetical protein
MPIAPKSRSPVCSLLGRPRLRSLRCCLHHATSAPLFADTPARRSQGRVAPTTCTASSALNRASLLTSPPMAKDAMRPTKPPHFFALSFVHHLTIRRAGNGSCNHWYVQLTLSSAVHWS